MPQESDGGNGATFGEIGAREIARGRAGAGVKIVPQSEQDVRQIIENQLANAGWEERFMAREVPKHADQKTALGKLRPDWMLYTEDQRNPVAVIEAKKPQKGQKNLADALKQGAVYAGKLGCPVVFASDGDVVMTQHMSNQKPLMIGTQAVSHFLPPQQMLKFLSSNVWHRGEKFSESGGLVRLFNSAKKTLNKEGIAKMDAFNEFAKLLFVKILTELHESGDVMFSGIPAKWDDFATSASEQLKSRYGEALAKLNDGYEGGFSQSQIKRPDVLEKLVGLVAPHSFIDTEEDVKGRAYEYFLRDYTKDKDELNRYFTPRHIVDAMVKMAKTRPGERVYDPFCGTGGMLIEAFRQTRRLLPPTGAARAKALNNLRMKCLYGRDISDAAYIAKMNMVLSGDGHSNIERGDSLSREAAAKSAGKYDIVLTNIPFSEKESEYIRHCLNAIRGREGARAAIIVPERVVGDPGHDNLRREILRDFWLERVVSLPHDVFAEYTSAKTSVIVVSYRGAGGKKQETFEFFDLHSDGLEGKARRNLSVEADNDLEDMLAGRLPPKIINLQENKFLFSSVSVLSVVPKGKCDMKEMKDVLTLLSREYEIKPGDTCREPGFNSREHRVYVKKRKSYSEVAKSGRKRTLIKKGDLVVGMMHTQRGLVAFSDCEDDLHSTGTHRVFEVNEKVADRRYVFWVLRELVMKTRKDDTTGRENYSVEDILNLPLPLPSLPEQRKIAAAMDKAREKIRAAERALQQAEADFASAGEEHLPFKIAFE